MEEAHHVAWRTCIVGSGGGNEDDLHALGAVRNAAGDDDDDDDDTIVAAFVVAGDADELSVMLIRTMML